MKKVEIKGKYNTSHGLFVVVDENIHFPVGECFTDGENIYTVKSYMLKTRPWQNTITYIVTENPIPAPEEFFCPVYGQVIDDDLCYETIMCLDGFFKADSIKELRAINVTDDVRKACKNCSRSDLS